MLVGNRSQCGKGGLDLLLALGLAKDVALVELLDLRTGELPKPAGEVRFFEREAFVAGRNGADLGGDGLEPGGQSPALAWRTVAVLLGEHAMVGRGHPGRARRRAWKRWWWWKRWIEGEWIRAQAISWSWVYRQFLGRWGVGCG